MRKLQDILDQFDVDSLPHTWQMPDLATFSASKRLWDYQQQALQCAVKALWRYYEDFADYQAGEAATVNAERKRRFMEWYRANDLNPDMDIAVSETRRDIQRLLDDNYPVANGKVAYEHLINRMGFWMATGSGKTLVLVKLIEMLWRLSRLQETPPHDILVLTHRDDLIEQLRRHVAEFNATRGDLTIILRDLREYPDVKRAAPSLLRDQEATIFVYRSDNLSDEQKEKIIDYRNYDNNGQWYVLLDEAHKGDKEDSKRQHIYSALARNGFLFNFSATFTDQRDILTTAYDFNLARFTAQGYGKHISILKQENRAFRDDEDYTGDEKQKVVLKSLVMLAYMRKAKNALQVAAGTVDMYHSPLLLALVNSVNIQDADLKLFFRELARIGRGGVDDATWVQAKDELWAELSQHPPFLFEDAHFITDKALFDSISLHDLLEAVYNAPGPGEMEVWVRPSDRQEVAFKLKTADRPFALIKIGDITEWLKQELAGYEITESFQDEGFFVRLNAGSDINILMGSRSFYEGWDSNRPNVITFINIGTGTDARKFILQSIGRGVRIEPFKGKRRRLQNIFNAGEVARDLYWQVKDDALPLESLLIFGTNRTALQTVVQQVDLIASIEDEQEVALSLNDAAIEGRCLLIPVYRQGDRPLMEERAPQKFALCPQDLEMIDSYLDYLGDDRLLFARHHATPRQIGLLHRVMDDQALYFNTSSDKRCGGVGVILPRLCSYFALAPKAVQGVKPLDGEIRHYQHIKVLLRDISDLQLRIQRTIDYPRRLGELKAKYDAHQLSFELFVGQAQQLRDTETFTSDGQTVALRHVANHYYIPLISSTTDKVDYMRHIIRHPSEVKFVNDLANAGNVFGAFDWWAFSKLDETLDDVYLPYYDPDANRIRQFKPDFIFWLQKGNEYQIAFVDPKGMTQSGYEHKIDGYKQLFLDSSGSPRIVEHNGMRVRVSLFLYTQDANRAPMEYQEYWFDRPEGIASHVQTTLGMPDA